MWSYPTRKRKFQKNSKKIQKIGKHHLSFFTSQNRLGKPAKERKKKKKLFRCGPTRPVIEISKKTAKKYKKLENSILAFLQAKIGLESPQRRENRKNYSAVFLPDP